jgi:hypothetical protein
MSVDCSSYLKDPVLHSLKKINNCDIDINTKDLDYSVQWHCQQYFIHIMAISLIVGGHQITRKKPSHWQTVLHNSVSNINTQSIQLI